MVSERPFKRRRTGARRRRPRGVVRGRIHRLSCCRWGTFHFRMDESIARWLVQKISMFQKSALMWQYVMRICCTKDSNDFCTG
ncbi:uncharacterized protein LOC103703041 isoform X2 [Phoenix dactylifera]|uniref:Uncharacterized protein LOC103703041 isoform X2 n=1 Tax=Phoenix dactylifera TaxID=42345 RepID=A0A8B8J1R8_PHODC|nr:uncharacterized protein LOC103703041 isoform X2 [Phoenix dactylifera]